MTRGALALMSAKRERLQYLRQPGFNSGTEVRVGLASRYEVANGMDYIIKQ